MVQFISLAMGIFWGFPATSTTVQCITHKSYEENGLTTKLLQVFTCLLNSYNKSVENYIENSLETLNI